MKVARSNSKNQLACSAASKAKYLPLLGVWMLGRGQYLLLQVYCWCFEVQTSSHKAYVPFLLSPKEESTSADTASIQP